MDNIMKSFLDSFGYRLEEAHQGHFYYVTYEDWRSPSFYLTRQEFKEIEQEGIKSWVIREYPYTIYEEYRRYIEAFNKEIKGQAAYCIKDDRDFADLVNKLTVVARMYSHTDQLRARISSTMKEANYEPKA